MAVHFERIGQRPGDSDWIKERYEELVRATIAARNSTFAINFGTWVLIALACAMLPNRAAFIAPLLLRLLTMLTTIFLSVRLHQMLVAKRDFSFLIRATEANLFFVGASWALLLLPILAQPDRHPAHIVVGCGVFVVVGSVMTTLSALQIPFLAFAFGFFLPLLGAVLGRGGMVHIEIAAAFACLFAVMLAYTRAAGQQRIIAADTIVENRRLSCERLALLDKAKYDALHDPLTGLYNRRALFGSALVDPQDRRRKHVLLIDLDHFKQLNDSFGHEMGDRVLQGVAKGFADILGTLPGDEHFAVRLGGEEFAVVLFLSDAERAHEVAEKIRFMVALVAGRVGLAKARTTASIGLTHFDCGERIDDVFARADKAMYRAKSSGRNQVRRHAA